MSIGGSGDERLSKNQRREAAREKARVLREQHKRKERRNRFVLQGGLIIISLAIVAVVTLIIVNSVRPPSPGPLNMLSDGITIGTGFEALPTAALQADAAPVATVPDPATGAIAIQIWVDYQCPICKAFEDANSEQISTLVTQGVATLEIHPIAILDRASLGSRYSSRAANSAACVANFSPNSYYDYNAALYANQPAESTTGLTDDELIKITRDVGVSSASDIASCIKDETFKSWAAAATERAVSDTALLNEQGNFGTPTILVDGKRYTGSPDDATAFAQFVAATDGAKFSQQNSSTPSPAPSPAPSAAPSP